ncbi:hypothetical protein SCHAM137S_00049 [Streptomyces chartreusis]
MAWGDTRVGGVPAADCAGWVGVRRVAPAGVWWVGAVPGGLRPRSGGCCASKLCCFLTPAAAGGHPPARPLTAVRGCRCAGVRRPRRHRAMTLPAFERTPGTDPHHPARRVIQPVRATSAWPQHPSRPVPFSPAAAPQSARAIQPGRSTPVGPCRFRRSAAIPSARPAFEDEAVQAEAGAGAAAPGGVVAVPGYSRSGVTRGLGSGDAVTCGRRCVRRPGAGRSGSARVRVRR